MIRYSVVIPVYCRNKKHLRFVIKTLTELIKKSPEAEIIIVDDGSPISMKILKTLGGDLYIEYKKNRGISAAWNTGKNRAGGAYIAIVNDDVRVPVGWLDCLAGGFRDKSAGVSAPSRGLNYIEPEIYSKNYTFEDKVFYPGYCFMLKRDRFFEDFDAQFTTNCGDVDYWHRIYKRGLKCIRVGMQVWHKEASVLGEMGYAKLSGESIDLFIRKWGFSPQTEYY